MELNILYLAELNPLSATGGGEQITKSLLYEFMNRRHQVAIAPPSVSEIELTTFIKDANIIFCFDLHNEPNKNPRTWFSERTLGEVIEHGNYVMGATGYCDVCPYDYLPCSGTKNRKCHDCFDKGVVKHLWKNSKERLFLSPLHAQTSLNILGLSDLSYKVMIPDINEEIFSESEEEKDIDFLHCGVVCEAKGYHIACNYIKENKLEDKNIVWIGDSLVGKPKYGTHISKVAHKEVVKYMKRAKNFFSLTRWQEAFGLSTIEALKCGCNIIHNNNIGCLSCFGYDLVAAKKHRFSGSYKEISEYFGIKEEKASWDIENKRK